MADVPSALNPETSPLLQQQALDQQMNQPVMQQQQAEMPQQAQLPEYTTPLLQNATKKLVDVPQDDLDTAVRSGEYSPKKDAQFVVLDKSGTKNIVSGDDLHKALDSGMLLETGQERHEREIQEQYGNNTAASFVEGAGRGALGIASMLSAGLPGSEGERQFTPDEAMQGLSNLAGDNFTQAHFRGNAEANPISSTLGDITGSIAALGPSGVSAGASAVEKQVAKAVLKDATTAGLSRKIAASLASKAAGSAVEGAFFGANQLVSEDSIGKADFNAENLAVAMGTGALINGALGTAIGAATEALPGVKALGKLVTNPLKNTAEASIDQQVSAARLLGLTPNQLAKLESRNPGLVAGMQDYLKDDLQLGLTDTAETLAHKNRLISERSGKAVGDTLDEINVALKDNPELKPQASQVWDSVYAKVYKQFEGLIDSGAPGTSAEVSQVTKFLDDVSNLGKKGGELDAGQLQKLKRIQDELINYDKEPGKWTIKQEMAHLTRQALKSEIDAVANKLESAGLASDVASKLKTANRQFASSSTFGDFLEKKALKNADRDWSLIGALKGVGLDITRKLAVLGKLEGAKQSVDRLATKAIDAMTSPVTTKIAKAGKQYASASIIDSAFARKFEDGKYKKPKNVAEAFSNSQDNFARYMQNPEAFTNRVNRSTSAIYKQAPNTSSALDTLAIQGGQFLASKLPKRVTNPGIIDMNKAARPPSKLDLAKYERYMTAVESPGMVFTAMEQGRLSHEHVEALQATYPQLYFQLQNKAMEAVKKHPDMPYNKKLQLGLLLNVPTDESLLPENVLHLQANFGPLATQEQNEVPSAISATQSGVAKIDTSSRAQTNLESTEESLHS